MASYAICSTIYNNAIGLINDARYTRERRIEIEKICDEAFRTMHEYQTVLVEYSEQKTKTLQKKFDDFFVEINQYSPSSDPEQMFRVFSELNSAFGIQSPFANFSEFDEKMSDCSTLLVF